MSPLANSFLTAKQTTQMEATYPLKAFVCRECLLVQVQQFESPDKIFSDYAYFSSYSASWLRHCSEYVDAVVGTLGLDTHSQVVELASNDGYLLQYFKQKKIPVLGIEPAENVARVAIDKGIPTEIVFFGERSAHQLKEAGHAADLIIANNVLAHVPDINSFVKGIQVLLKPLGTATLEFPHLLNLFEQNQFDTIYHEHFSYFSLLTVEKIFNKQGLTVFDVEQLQTHGGSLRIHVRHTEDRTRSISPRVDALRALEVSRGLDQAATYRNFARQVVDTKWALLEFLIQAKRAGKRVVAYGAAAKGNTLLNYCGVRSDFIDYVVDLNPHKQNRYLPGSHIPIKKPDAIKQTRPDYVLILPWNLQTEIIHDLAYIQEWGGKCVVPIPRVRVL